MKAKSIVSKIINIISIIIIIFAAIILVSVIFTKSGKVPSIAGFSFFRVLTGSMEPEIPTGSFIMVKKTDTADIKVGDIISFYSSDPELEGAVNTHRVVEITEQDGKTYFETKGDANMIADDELVNSDNVIGVVIWKSQFLGSFVKLITNPLIFFPLIIVPLIVLIVTNVITSVKNTKEILKQEEDEAMQAAIEEYKRRKAEEQHDDEDDNGRN